MGEPSQRSPEQCELGDFLQGGIRREYSEIRMKEKKKRLGKKKKKGLHQCVSRREIEHTIVHRLFLCMPRRREGHPVAYILLPFLHR